MRSNQRFCASVLVLIVAVACGKKNDSPTDPTPPPAANRNPSIASATASPAFGVVGLSQLTLAASATDPDGDAVTYQWVIGSTTLTGANQTLPIPGDGPQTATVTVSDGKGGTATATASFASGSMNGAWNYTYPQCNNGSVVLTTTVQSSGTFSGTATLVGPLCNLPAGTTFQTDPAGPGTISAAGAIAMRLKLSGGFADVVVTGQMDTTGTTAGRRITGTATSVDGSVQSAPFTMVRP